MKKNLLKSAKIIQEKSAGLVIFYNDGTQPLFLLLCQPKMQKSQKAEMLKNDQPCFYGLAKGHIEKGESEIEAALREAREETGLKNLTIIDGFKESMQYFFKFKGKLYYKRVVFFLAESNTLEIKLSQEHIDYRWLPIKEALKTATFSNTKQLLKKSFAFIKKNVQ